MNKLFTSIIFAAAFSSALFAAPAMKVVMDKQLVKPGEPIKLTIHYQIGKNEKVSCYYIRGFAAEMPKAAQNSELFPCRVNKKDPRWTNYDIVKPVFIKVSPDELANGKVITFDTAKLPEGDYKLRFCTSFVNSETKKYTDIHVPLVFCVSADGSK